MNGGTFRFNMNQICQGQWGVLCTSRKQTVMISDFGFPSQQQHPIVSFGSEKTPQQSEQKTRHYYEKFESEKFSASICWGHSYTGGEISVSTELERPQSNWPLCSI
ncbi:hypothetical protein E2542_SST04403 [Spatholobus suberectus]|nr:hypothetical protein E2542_SST04403 [Spatholobus suberectus]